MNKLILLIILFINAFCWLNAQTDYEPIHGLSASNYNIKGELELVFTHFVDYKDGNKTEEKYQIKSPVILSFNFNDLRFFKAQPKEFIGYVENQYDAFSGFSNGCLFDIPAGGYQEGANWMQVNEHLKYWADGEFTEIKASGEIYPILKINFSIPGYGEKLKDGFDRLKFRITVSGISSHFDPVQNVVVELNNKTMNNSETDLIDKETMKNIELADPAAAAELKKATDMLQPASSDILFVNVSCGTFYGTDLAAAETANNLTNAGKSQKEIFEQQFESQYFKDMPHIDVSKLVNFLLKPERNYETQIDGSFSSDSDNGSEKAVFKGTLRLFSGQIVKVN